MLADKDRIFTNLYGRHDWRLKGARARGVGEPRVVRRAAAVPGGIHGCAVCAHGCRHVLDALQAALDLEAGHSRVHQRGPMVQAAQVLRRKEVFDVPARLQHSVYE